jgi:Skp family chaperone for outer membrane proteins
MKRFTSVVLLLLLVAVAAVAQNPPAAPTPPAAGGAAATATPPKPGSKVGVIDFNSALFDSEPGKAAVKEIEKGLEETKTKLEKTQKDLTDLQGKLQNAKTDTEKATITRDMDAKTTEGKRLSEDGQRTSEDLQQKHLPPVVELIKKMVDEYAKENDLAIVLDPTTEGTNIVFAARLSDITTEIIRRANAAYAKDPKVIAPGTAAPQPPAKPAN